MLYYFVVHRSIRTPFSLDPLTGNYSLNFSNTSWTYRNWEWVTSMFKILSSSHKSLHSYNLLFGRLDRLLGGYSNDQVIHTHCQKNVFRSILNESNRNALLPFQLIHRKLLQQELVQCSIPFLRKIFFNPYNALSNFRARSLATGRYLAGGST